MHEVLQQAVSKAAAMGTTILLQGMQIERPLDVMKATAPSAEDKRTILAAWVSDFYAVDSKPASAIFLVHLSRFPSTRFRLPSENLIGATASDPRLLMRPVSSTSPTA